MRWIEKELEHAIQKIEMLESKITELEESSLKELFKEIEIFFDYGQPNLPDFNYTAHCYYNNKSDSCIIKIKDGKLMFEF